MRTLPKQPWLYVAVTRFCCAAAAMASKPDKTATAAERKLMLVSTCTFSPPKDSEVQRVLPGGGSGALLVALSVRVTEAATPQGSAEHDRNIGQLRPRRDKGNCLVGECHSL